MVKKALSLAQIGGISLNSTSEEEVLGEIINRIKKNKKTFIVTPNPEFIVFAQTHPWFKKILNQADFAIPDGVGLIWASRFLALRSPTEILMSASDSLAKRRTLLKGTHRRSQGEASQNLWAPRAKQKGFTLRPPIIKERISGTDLMEKLCQEAGKRGWSIYLLGGQPGVAAAAAAKLKTQNAKLKIWAKAGPKLELVTDHWPPITEKKITKIIQEINAKEPDLLFIAFGMGKQEKFIYDNWDKLKVKLAMGVGGAFDYLSGQIPRAPKWVRRIGLEWLFRLTKEPWRWRRQLALLQFTWLVTKEKFSS